MGDVWASNLGDLSASKTLRESANITESMTFLSFIYCIDSLIAMLSAVNIDASGLMICTIKTFNSLQTHAEPTDLPSLHLKIPQNVLVDLSI